MEARMSTLHAEADARELQLAQQRARAEAAQQECATLNETLAASETQLATHQATHAQQVGLMRNPSNYIDWCDVLSPIVQLCP